MGKLATLCLLAVSLASEPRPGLIGRFTDGSRSAVFLASSPNFYLDPGESIHPSLAPSFQGQWEAVLQVLAAGQYEFNRPVTLQGKTAATHILAAGSHRILVPFTRVSGSPAQIRLEWRTQSFPWEPVPRSAFTHDSASEPPSNQEGRRLVFEAGCANCHAVPGLARTAPALAGLGARTSANWIYAKLESHAGVALTNPQRTHVTAYLAASKSTAPRPRKTNEVIIGKGGELFGTMGCVFCHASGSLAAVGGKYSLNALTARLQDDHQPSMLLNDDDAVALASFLLRTYESPALPAAPAGDAVQGAALLGTLHCNGCHQPGTASRAIPTAECRVVRNSWTQEQKRAVNAYLAENALAKYPAPLHALETALERYQCHACHKPGTEAPELHGVGEKLKTAWIGQVLWNKKRIRPGRELRMPHYEEAAMRPLAAALAKNEGLAPGDGGRPPASTDAERSLGIGLLSTNIKKQGMACIGCHDWGTNKSLGEEGPQLINAAERMRYEWYERWMRNPARILSGTSMPSYFSNMPAERSQPRIHALWAAMEWGARAPVPDGFHASDLEVTSEAKPVVGKDPVVIRWDMPEATPAAIAVGLPGGVSYCFDAGQSRLLYAWRGGFLDLTGTLLRKTDERKLTPTAALVGQVFWRASAEKQTQRRQFKGYRLLKGIPEFRYLVDGIEVRELLTPAPNGTIRRQIIFAEVKAPMFFEGHAVAAGTNVTVEAILQ